MIHNFYSEYSLSNVQNVINDINHNIYVVLLVDHYIIVDVYQLIVFQYHLVLLCMFISILYIIYRCPNHFQST